MEDSSWISSNRNKRSILYVNSVTNKRRLNVPSGTIKCRLNTRPRPHAYISPVHRVHKGVPSAKHEVCCVQKACRLQNYISNYIYHIHNVHTNVHTTHNNHSQCTLRHTLALPITQAYRHDIIIKRSPATVFKDIFHADYLLHPTPKEFTFDHDVNSILTLAAVYLWLGPVLVDDKHWNKSTDGYVHIHDTHVLIFVLCLYCFELVDSWFDHILSIHSFTCSFIHLSSSIHLFVHLFIQCIIFSVENVFARRSFSTAEITVTLDCDWFESELFTILIICIIQWKTPVANFWQGNSLRDDRGLQIFCNSDYVVPACSLLRFVCYHSILWLNDNLRHLQWTVQLCVNHLNMVTTICDEYLVDWQNAAMRLDSVAETIR